MPIWMQVHRKDIMIQFMETMNFTKGKYNHILGTATYIIYTRYNLQATLFQIENTESMLWITTIIY